MYINQTLIIILFICLIFGIVFIGSQIDTYTGRKQSAVSYILGAVITIGIIIFSVVINKY